MIRSTRFLVLIVVAGGQLVLAQPVIHKVEPPNWWIGLKTDTVQLMVYGSDLSGVEAGFDKRGLTAVRVHESGNSSYCFVDVYIPPDARARSYSLVLTKEKWVAEFPFPLLQRDSVAGKHQGFGPEDVIYLITPDRFANGDPENDSVPGLSEQVDRSQPYGRHGGDIQGMIDRLGYLRDLGVTAIWPNPLVENRGKTSYHGYAATDLYRIDPRFGTNELSRTFVHEAHRNGLKVIMDHVNNHIGIMHPWLENLPTGDWLNGSVASHQKSYHGKAELTDIYSDPVTKSKATHGWFTDYMPDLNQRNPFVRNYLIQSTIWWIEYSGIDGIREDTYPYIDHRFAAEWCAAIKREYPSFNIVGEVWIQDPTYLAPYQAGSCFPKQFDTNLPTLTDFGLFDAFMRVFAGNESIGAIHGALTKDFLYPDPSVLVTFLDNHDIRRIMYHLNGNVQRLKLALTILLTTRGIPQLLYGTEIGMIGGKDHGTLRADFPGGFPGDDRDAFTREGRTAEENNIFDFTSRLLRLRKDYRSLTNGTLVHFTPQDEVYVYFRKTPGERIMVVVNNNPNERAVPLEPFAHQLEGASGLRSLMEGGEQRLGSRSEVTISGFTAGIFLLLRQGVVEP